MYNKQMRIGAAGLTLALAVGLAACSSGSDSSSNAGAAQEITFLTHWGPDQVAMLNAAGKAFTAKNPTVTVKVRAVPFGNLLSTLRTQGASPDGPTIAGIYDAWLPELARDKFAAPAPKGVSDAVTAGWAKGAVKGSTSQGAIYGIPNEIDLYQLNYNKALFKTAGINEPPKDWAALEADAAKLAGTGTGTQGLGVITNWNSGVVHPFLSLLASNGGSFLNAEGTASNLTSPQALETAQLYERLVKSGATKASMSTANANTTGPYLDNFVNGKTGMIIMANWWESALKAGMGPKYSDVATAPIPMGPSGTTSSSISYSWLTMVNGRASQGKQDAAWKFLQYLNGTGSGKGGSSAMADILTSMGILPSRTEDIQAHKAALETPFLSSYVAALDKATPFPTVLGGAAATDALQRQLESLISGKVDAKTAMDNAAKDVDAALQSAK